MKAQRRQFVTMTKWGMTPMQAIQAATANAARRWAARAMSAPSPLGRYGDLIARCRDPIADIALLQSVGLS